MRRRGPTAQASDHRSKLLPARSAMEEMHLVTNHGSDGGQRLGARDLQRIQCFGRGEYCERTFRVAVIVVVTCVSRYEAGSRLGEVLRETLVHVVDKSLRRRHVHHTRTLSGEGDV